MKLKCVKDAYDEWSKNRIYTRDKEYDAIESGNYIVIPENDNMIRDRISSASFIIKHFVLSNVGCYE